MALNYSTPFHVPQIRRTTQACDACKLRKVKCNGQERCQQCSHLNLRCVYSAPKPRAKSLKRGQLIAKYKQSTTSTNGPPGSGDAAKVKEQQSPCESPVSTTTLPAIATLLSESPSSSAAHSPPQDSNFFVKFLKDYEESVYPVNPVMTVEDVQASINEMHLNAEARAFVYAYVAVTINLTGYSTDLASTDTVLGQVGYWTDECTKARGPTLPSTRATVRRIMTSQFLHICLMGLSNQDMAFYYLRESITMIQMLRIDHPETMKTLSLSELSRRQRLYCEAFVHERYMAILDYRPIALPPLPYMPVEDPSLPPGVHEGFIQIIKLFSLVDHEFVGNWLGSHSGSTRAVTTLWVEEKQKQIDAEHAGDDVQVSTLTDMQQADLVITKHWLRTLVWQMAMSKCLLSSAASKESMSLLFPVRLSRHLRHLIGKMTRHSIEIHGSGIQQKLFELTDTIANVIITVPAATVEETTGRVDDFMFLVTFFFALPRFDAVHRGILQKKLETLQAMFPYSANTPDSTTLPSGAVEEKGDDVGGDEDPWLGVTRGYHDEYQGELSPQSPLTPMTTQAQAPPARIWQDMTRRLSMAPFAAAAAAANGTHAGVHAYQTH